MKERFINHLIKDIFSEIFSKVEEKFLKKETKEEKTEEYTVLKNNSMYVVNVCALFILSNRQILLSGSGDKILGEIKGKKYRPIIVYKIKNKQVGFFALSTDEKAVREKEIVFENRFCNFITTECFLSRKSQKDIGNQESIIFYRTIKRRENKYVQKAIFELPLSVFIDLKDFEDAKNKEEVMEICELPEHYKFIKRCADCDKDYINSILEKINRGNK